MEDGVGLVMLAWIIVAPTFNFQVLQPLPELPSSQMVKVYVKQSGNPESRGGMECAFTWSNRIIPSNTQGQVRSQIEQTKFRIISAYVGATELTVRIRGKKGSTCEALSDSVADSLQSAMGNNVSVLISPSWSHFTSGYTAVELESLRRRITP